MKSFEVAVIARDNKIQDITRYMIHVIHDTRYMYFYSNNLLFITEASVKKEVQIHYVRRRDL